MATLATLCGRLLDALSGWFGRSLTAWNGYAWAEDSDSDSGSTGDGAGSGIPAPYAYFAFEDSDPWTSYTGTGQIATTNPSYPWTGAAGGVYGYSAQETGSGGIEQALSGLLASRTSMALSCWLGPGALLNLRRSSGEGLCTIENTGASWQHWLVLLTSSGMAAWRNGLAVPGPVGTLYQDAAFRVVLWNALDTCDELAIWESPDWTQEQAAEIAAAIYNGGIGTVYRDSEWQELV